MDISHVLLLLLGPPLVVALAAVWPPTWRQCLLLLLGFTLYMAFYLELPGTDQFRALGLLVLLGIPYLTILLLPLLPWRRRWARWAVPGTVGAAITVVVLASGEIAEVGGVLFLPILCVLGALTFRVLQAAGPRTGSTAHPPDASQG